MKGKKSKKESGSQEVTRWILAIVLLALGLILLLAAFGSAGFAGIALFSFTRDVFGLAAFVLPLCIVAIGVMVILQRNLVPPLVAAGGALIVISILAILGIM